MKAYGRFVEHKDRVALSPAHLAGQFKSLGLTSGQARGLFSQCQIAKAEITQDSETLTDEFQISASVKGGIDVHIHQLWKRMELSCRILPPDASRRF